VVVPVYNGAATLDELVTRLVAVLRPRGAPFEVILVNDGSRDQSWSTITRLSAAVPELVGVDLLRNFGQHNALLCGIRTARHDVIVTMDDDLQQLPEEIPTLVAALGEDHDVVYGTAAQRPHGRARHLASRLTKAALRSTLGSDIAPMVSTFRAFRGHLTRAFEHYESPLVSIDVLLGWSTSRFTSVTVPHRERQVGRSNYTFRALVRHTLNMVTGFSILPLQLATVIGFVSMLFGLAVLVFVLIRYLREGSATAPGFPFLASIIVIFAGAQLFALGIIGEYLGRMHLRSMARPTYAVRRRVVQGREP
jgi:undecaprenyl-phosphate 4-deoxy-4-formamido-L-arabinose transferase